MNRMPKQYIRLYAIKNHVKGLYFRQRRTGYKENINDAGKFTMIQAKEIIKRYDHMDLSTEFAGVFHGTDKELLNEQDINIVHEIAEDSISDKKIRKRYLLHTLFGHHRANQIDTAWVFIKYLTLFGFFALLAYGTTELILLLREPLL